jgi:hypothetical protein
VLLKWDCGAHPPSFAQLEDAIARVNSDDERTCISLCHCIAVAFRDCAAGAEGVIGRVIVFLSGSFALKKASIAAIGAALKCGRGEIEPIVVQSVFAASIVRVIAGGGGEEETRDSAAVIAALLVAHTAGKWRRRFSLPARRPTSRRHPWETSPSWRSNLSGIGVKRRFNSD